MIHRRGRRGSRRLRRRLAHVPRSARRSRRGRGWSGDACGRRVRPAPRPVRGCAGPPLHRNTARYYRTLPLTPPAYKRAPSARHEYASARAAPPHSARSLLLIRHRSDFIIYMPIYYHEQKE